MSNERVAAAETRHGQGEQKKAEKHFCLGKAAAFCCCSMQLATIKATIIVEIDVLRPTFLG